MKSIEVDGVSHIFLFSFFFLVVFGSLFTGVELLTHEY